MDNTTLEISNLELRAIYKLAIAGLKGSRPLEEPYQPALKAIIAKCEEKF